MSSIQRGHVAAALLLVLGGGAQAEPGGGVVGFLANAFAEKSGEAETPLEALVGGKFSLDMRPRLELAKADQRGHSEALTLRTRLGYGTKPWYGLSIYGDFENIAAVHDEGYFDAVSMDNGKTVIADPEHSEINQAYVRYENDELLGSSVVAGLQRIILDDARFIGNVGWRQNEQTYEAGRFQSSLGREDVAFTYGYVWDVHRPFGDQGGPATRDFDSESHLINLAYSGFEPVRLAAFAYLLDLENAPLNSSNSYGLRLNGSRELGGAWIASYAASYAHQNDAANNPVDYGAHYYSVDGALGHSSLGTLGLGFEVLGSDAGVARFVTPLATLHKFNGWADAFLDNGGVNGLRDLYVYLEPTLPWELDCRLVYHHFESDRSGRRLGEEIDASIRKSFLGYFTALAKVAYFDGSPRSGRRDRYRFWLQLTFRL